MISPDIPSRFVVPAELGSSSSPFTEFGSDKDSRHSYGGVYFDLLGDNRKPSILEIGVGSVNDYPYAGLAAGGGLFGFKKRYPESELIGLDIDPESIEIIKRAGFHGYVLDQTSDNSLKAVKQKLLSHSPFDLIIDDGFHDPHANVRTLKVLHDLLSESGTYVIEDVHESLIDFWKVISVHLPGKMEVIDMRYLRPTVDDNVLLLFTK
jgi:hypothetical protein